MPEAVSKIRETLLYSTVVFDEKGHVEQQIMKDNRGSAVIWSVLEIVLWTACLIMSFTDDLFEVGRIVYVPALSVAVLTFILSAFVARRHLRITRFIVILMQIALMAAGIGIAFCQPEVRSATFIAAVLIVPVMFVSDTLPTMLYAMIGIVGFQIFSTGIIEPDVQNWTFKSLVIFSITGVLIGHIINKSRFERYAYAESALELAELRNYFAYYDQLSGLQNRRAFSEKIEQLSHGMPDECCVVSLDINGLKTTNDTYGHNAGDELIVGAAECLNRCFTDVEGIYRLGGDEFCVIAMQPAEQIADRLPQLERMTAEWKGEIVDGISFSYGVASSQDNPDIESLLRTADRNMYAFKRRYYTTSGHERRHA